MLSMILTIDLVKSTFKIFKLLIIDKKKKQIKRLQINGKSVFYEYVP